MKNPQQRFLYRAGFGVFVLAGLYIAWQQLRAPSVVRAANTLAAATVSQDTETIARFAHSREAMCSEYVPSQLKEVWEELLGEAIRNSKIIRMEQATQPDNSTSALSNIILSDLNGNSWKMYWVVHESDEGPNAAVLWSLIVFCLQLDGRGNVHTEQNLDHLRDSLDRVGKVLNKHGIKKVMTVPSVCVDYSALAKEVLSSRSGQSR
jgi:hypothetical protein